MPTQAKRKVPPLKTKGHWTQKEETFLARNYKKLTDREISDILGRGVGGIAWKRAQLGLAKEPSYADLQHLSGKPSPASSPADDEPIITPSKSVWQRIADWWNGR